MKIKYYYTGKGKQVKFLRGPAAVIAGSAYYATGKPGRQAER
jgi:hypothetical protein